MGAMDPHHVNRPIIQDVVVIDNAQHHRLNGMVESTLQGTKDLIKALEKGEKAGQSNTFVNLPQIKELAPTLFKISRFWLNSDNEEARQLSRAASHVVETITANQTNERLILLYAGEPRGSEPPNLDVAGRISVASTLGSLRYYVEKAEEFLGGRRLTA